MGGPIVLSAEIFFFQLRDHEKKVALSFLMVCLDGSSVNFSSILKSLFSCEGFLFFLNTFPILRWSSAMT